MKVPVKLAVLLSGSGRTLQNLIDRIDDGSLKAEITAVVSSRSDAYGLERARLRGLPTHVVERRAFLDTAAFSDAMTSLLGTIQFDLVILAGFLNLYLFPPKWAGQVLNIHPGLLPAFGGKGFYGHRVHEAVLAAGAKESGCTVHFAGLEYDSGPIILQERVPVLPGDTSDTLADRVFRAECVAYPEAIRRVAAERD